jgi:hypothetical protein
MEVIQTVFDQLDAEIRQKLKVLEKQVVFILSQAQQQPKQHTEEFLQIRAVMDSIQSRLGKMETRLQVLEVSNRPERKEMTTPSLSAGLEGLLMKPIALPSPALSARSENQVVLPIIQRQVVIPETEEAEPDEDALRGVVAEEVGGIDEEEEVDAGDQGDDEAEAEGDKEEDEEEEGEEEEAETIELEEFIWKGKTYFKTPDHMVYRANDEGDVEDEPFAKYDPKTNTLKRI